MEGHNSGNIQVCQLTSRDRLLDRQKMSNLGESVDDDKDRIMTLLGSRKTGDKVHFNLVPFPFRNREWLQSSSRSLMFGFDATANVTLINISSDVLLHLGTARVDRQRCIMSFFHDIRGVLQVGLGYRNH